MSAFWSFLGDASLLILQYVVYAYVYVGLAVLVIAPLWTMVALVRRKHIDVLICFSTTLYLSAFLLFLVQPMIGKMILPRLGGTPQVWNTCMMFFQIVLLAGYAYSHNVTAKLPVRKQLVTHCLVILLPLPVLLAFGQPFYVAGFGAEGGGNPIFATLGLLTVIVGIPFMVVSTTAPLLQRWFSNTGHPAASDPYFLYGASNAGSILGLLVYPSTIEMYLGLHLQAWLWLYIFIVLIILVGACALLVKLAPPAVQLPGMAGDIPLPEPGPAEMPVPPPPAPEPATTAITATPPAPSVPRTTGIRRGGKQRGRGGRGPVMPATVKAGGIELKKVTHEPIEEEKPFEMTTLRRVRWVGLAAVTVSLMLGCTTYISTDISPVPLLWIVPLTLYLLSFVLVFLRWPVPWVGVGRNPRNFTPHKAMVVLQLIGFAVVMIIIMRGDHSPVRAMLACWVSFFLTALVCHGELARDRPPAHHLTEFFLWMSVGGMLGGVFNAMVAPLVPWFGLFEFPLAIVLAALVRPFGQGSSWTDIILQGMPKEQANGLKYVIDIVAGVLMLIFVLILVNVIADWKNLWDYARYAPAQHDAITQRNMKNVLFRVVHKTLGFHQYRAVDIASSLFLVLNYVVPIGVALLAWKRPTRLALCLGAVLLGNAIYENSVDNRTVKRDRSYFGILRVIEDDDNYIESLGIKDKDGKVVQLGKARALMHGTTHHGLNFFYPPELVRLATTYYHRDGPVGAVMEKVNWFPGLIVKEKDSAAGKGSGEKDNRITYWADNRMPASLVGLGVPMPGVNLPMAQIADMMSEQPIATIGLGTGTMASYGRPLQHVIFYEIDDHVRNFSLAPDGEQTYFTYVQGAIKRGAKVEIIMGDARLTMTKEEPDLEQSYRAPKFPTPSGFVAPDKGNSYPKREAYYRVLEVDAFSSDAIPVHLITKEAIELYISKMVQGGWKQLGKKGETKDGVELTEDEQPPKGFVYDKDKHAYYVQGGVVCVHTSNRHVNLVQPVIKICEVAEWDDWNDRDADGKPKRKNMDGKDSLKWSVGKDNGERTVGHFGSEYVLVARNQLDLPPYAPTPEQMETYKQIGARPVAMDDKQEKLFKDAGLSPVRSTIFWFVPGMADDGGSARDRFMPPPGMRVWTDDYSNILSVFRW